MRTDEQRLLEELGNTQTVKDVQAAYNQIYEAKRQSAVQMKHARQDKQKLQAEIATFLDDLKDITGLPLNSQLLVQIASVTIARRLARRKLANSSIAQDDFPNGW
jgi:hypothetical protein